VFARLAVGRAPHERAHFLDVVNRAIHLVLGAGTTRLAISVEYIEIQPELRVNSNHIRAAG
jgi:hypothetical protein